MSLMVNPAALARVHHKELTSEYARLYAGLTDAGKWRLVPIEANRMPAMASYLLAPGDDTYRAFKIDVVRFEGGMVAEITTFGAALFPEFGLPPTR